MYLHHRGGELVREGVGSFVLVIVVNNEKFPKKIEGNNKQKNIRAVNIVEL